MQQRILFSSSVTRVASLNGRCVAVKRYMTERVVAREGISGIATGTAILSKLETKERSMDRRQEILALPGRFLLSTFQSILEKRREFCGAVYMTCFFCFK